MSSLGFRAALSAEWTKLSSLRSFRVTLVLGTALGIGLAALLAWAILLTWREWPAEEVAAFDPTESAMIGTLATTILFAVLGVTAVSSEYASRMIVLTFTATPRRGRVLAAKLIVVSAAAVVATLVAAIGMVVAVRLLLARVDLPTAPLGATAGTVLGVAGLSFVLPYLAVCLATAIRSAAGTVAAILGMIFVPAVVTPLLPAWWKEQGQRYLVGNAADSLSFSGEPQYLARPVAAVVLVAWLAAFTALAYVTVQRRDA